MRHRSSELRQAFEATWEDGGSDAEHSIQILKQLRDELASERTKLKAAHSEIVQLHALLAKVMSTSAERDVLSYQLGSCIIKSRSPKTILVLPYRLFRILWRFRSRRRVREENVVSKIILGPPPARRLSILEEARRVLDSRGSEEAMAWIRSHNLNAADTARVVAEFARQLIHTNTQSAFDLAVECWTLHNQCDYLPALVAEFQSRGALDEGRRLASLLQ